MTTLAPSYGTPTAITCTTTSLASDGNLLAGRQSNIVNNTSDLAVDSIIGGTIATSGTPTSNTNIELWLFGSWDNGTTFSGGASSGGDANFSPASNGVKQTMKLTAVISQTDAVARTYTIGPFSVAQACGGTMPDHWGFYVVHNTGTTLGATTLKYTPVKYTNT